MIFRCCLLLFFLCCSVLPAVGKETNSTVHVREDTLGCIFSGEERMHFIVSWSEGIKIGDLYLTITPDKGEDAFVITARVTDYGVFRLFYPVDDTFSTLVQGPMKLPVRYEVRQKEGYGGGETRRLTLYDQDKRIVSYQKNRQPLKNFTISGTAYNEFSSFFITRALLFSEKDNVVPTFVDEKRHEVAVVLLGREKKESLLGAIETLKVMPKMDFKGLYDKDGDTVFWLSNDRCRIPVAIHSKILVGSLTAELVEYDNAACPKWTGRKKQ